MGPMERGKQLELDLVTVQGAKKSPAGAALCTDPRKVSVSNKVNNGRGAILVSMTKIENSRSKE